MSEVLTWEHTDSFREDAYHIHVSLLDVSDLFCAQRFLPFIVHLFSRMRFWPCTSSVCTPDGRDTFENVHEYFQEYKENDMPQEFRQSLQLYMLGALNVGIRTVWKYAIYCGNMHIQATGSSPSKAAAFAASALLQRIPFYGSIGLMNYAIRDEIPACMPSFDMPSSYPEEQVYPFYGSQYELSNLYIVTLEETTEQECWTERNNGPGMLFSRKLWYTTAQLYAYLKLFYAGYQGDADALIRPQNADPIRSRNSVRRALQTTPHFKRERWHGSDLIDGRLHSHRAVLAMYEALYTKYSQSDKCRDALKATGKAFLIDASRDNGFWGAYRGMDDPNIRNPKNVFDEGENWNGLTQMFLRHQITQFRAESLLSKLSYPVNKQGPSCFVVVD
jgi:hypothetical protein